MTQETWARTPSDKSLLKKKGAILGGTGRTKQVKCFRTMLELDRERTPASNEALHDPTPAFVARVLLFVYYIILPISKGKKRIVLDARVFLAPSG